MLTEISTSRSDIAQQPASSFRQLHLVQSTLRPKLGGFVFNCPRKNVVNVGPCLTYYDQNHPDYKSRLRTKSKLRIPIMNPDYGSGITDPGLRIWIMNQDYESGLWIWITDYGSRLRNKDRDKFGNDG